MQTQIHHISGPTPGSHFALQSLHFGPTQTGRKVYLQASLHADELPGMVVLHHLRALLSSLEQAGRLHHEIVLVPMANPLGLAQSILHQPQGRFHQGTGENFNRHYPDLTDAVWKLVQDKLGADETTNAHIIRTAIQTALNDVTTETPLQDLRLTLLKLAADAELVLDLHCDCEAVMHLYTLTPLWPRFQPLADGLGAHVCLLATESGDHPFDEACSQLWWRLRTLAGPTRPVPLACAAVTVELRGERDTDHALGWADAQHILHFLAQEGIVGEEPGVTAPEAGTCLALPLSGCEPVIAPNGGVIVWHRDIGGTVKQGEHLADLIDPLTGQATPLNSPIDGHFFARELRRLAQRGQRVAKVAGTQARRTGKLLSD